MFVESWPHPHRPLVDGEPSTETVEVFQHRPDLTDALVAWCDGEMLMVNGGPAVLLPGRRKITERLVGLGDFAVKAGDTWRAEPAAGFATRFVAEGAD